MNAEQLVADAAAMVREWGEEVVYVPDTGAERTILAIVDRNPVRDVPEAPRPVPGKHIEVEVVNQATSLVRDANDYATDVGGITSAELAAGRDKLRLAVKLGETATERVVRKPIGHDEGSMIMELV